MLIVLIGLTFILGLLTRNQQSPLQQVFGPTPTPVRAPAVHFGSINYGKIFHDPQAAQAILDTLQTASGSSQKDDYTVVSFTTDADQRQNQVYEKDNAAQYIVQERTVDNSDLQAFLNTHPNAQGFQMFETESAGSGFSWYIYPLEGVAFLANKDSGGYAIRVLYFPKTTKETFLKTAAKTFDLLTTDPNSEDVQENFPESL